MGKVKSEKHHHLRKAKRRKREIKKDIKQFKMKLINQTQMTNSKQENLEMKKEI